GGRNALSKKAAHCGAALRRNRTLVVFRRDEHELTVEVDRQQIDADVEAVALIEGPRRADGGEDIATVAVLLPGFRPDVVDRLITLCHSYLLLNSCDIVPFARNLGFSGGFVVHTSIE